MLYWHHIRLRCLRRRCSLSVIATLFPIYVRHATLQNAVAAAERALNEAQEEATKALGAEQKDEDGTASRPMPQSVVSSDERYELESAAKKARKAGSCTSQVILTKV